jgi:hypothetical protein
MSMAWIFHSPWFLLRYPEVCRFPGVLAEANVIIVTANELIA